MSPARLRLNRPFNQNLIVGCILFCLPGMYLALTGLGAGGGRPSSQYVASDTNAILYGLFTVFGCLGGPLLNLLRPRTTFVIGAVGYPLYVGALWYFDRTGHKWFPLLAGAILGVTAGFLWTACGFVQFAYAEESEKATFITIQWAMTSLGGTVGACIAFSANFHEIQPVGVSTPVYAAFVTIMGLAAALAFLIIDPVDVVRDDGTHLATFTPPYLMDEIKGVLECFAEPRILLLLPAMTVAETTLVLMSSINGYFFNLRTRSLNNVLFEFAMIPTSSVLAWIMDTSYIAQRRTRGIAGVMTMAVVTIGTYAALTAFIQYNALDRLAPSPAVDWTDPRWAAGIVLYILSGTIYSGYQIVTQWVLGALTNSPPKCARYAGLFKGFTSLGLCVWFVLDGQGVSYQALQASQFACYALGLGCLAYVVWSYVLNTNYPSEENVISPRRLECQHDRVDARHKRSGDEAKAFRMEQSVSL